jgi:hypothetical protein
MRSGARAYRPRSTDSVNSSAPDPLRGMICLSLAVGFEEDRARLGLAAAVDRLRDALGYNGLTLDGESARQDLLALTPANYLGLAEDLALRC